MCGMIVEEGMLVLSCGKDLAWFGYGHLRS